MRFVEEKNIFSKTALLAFISLNSPLFAFTKPLFASRHRTGGGGDDRYP
jgi:hypothetical protein